MRFPSGNCLPLGISFSKEHRRTFALHQPCHQLVHTAFSSSKGNESYDVRAGMMLLVIIIIFHLELFFYSRAFGMIIRAWTEPGMKAEEPSLSSIYRSWSMRRVTPIQVGEIVSFFNDNMA